MTEEVNACLSSGCPGFCCRDMVMEMAEPVLERFRPPETPLVWLSPNSFSQMVKDGPDGTIDFDEQAPVIYATRNGGPLLQVQFDGACPNLSPDFGCRIYADRPGCCDNLDFMEAECLEIRNNHFLMV